MQLHQQVEILLARSNKSTLDLRNQIGPANGNIAAGAKVLNRAAGQMSFGGQ